MAVTEEGEDDDQTGDSGMGTGYESAQYLMRDILPGIKHLIDCTQPSCWAHKIPFYFDTCIHISQENTATGRYYVCLCTSQSCQGNKVIILLLWKMK